MVRSALRSRLRCTDGAHTRVDDWYLALRAWQQLAVMGVTVSAALWGDGVYADLGVGGLPRSVLLVTVPFVAFLALTALFTLANRRPGSDGSD